MTLSSGEAIPLIRTKLHQLGMSEDLVTRSHLIDSLNDGMNRKLTFVSVPNRIWENNPYRKL
jgi:ATP/maltotriose-dependent transcriptional regulator MalT